MKKFNKKEAIKFAWKKYKENWKFLALVMLGAWVAFVLIGNVFSSFSGNNPALSFVFRILINILEAIVGMGLVTIALNIVDNKTIHLSKIYTSKAKIFNYVMASLLYFLIVFVGFILLIVPGIYFGIKYHFFMYDIVDKNAGIIDSFKNSSKITSGNMLNLFLFGLINFGILTLGLFLLGVGLIAAIPVVILATAYVYRKLL